MKLKSKSLISGLVLIRVDPVVTEIDGVQLSEEWKTLPPTGVVLQIANDVTFCEVGDRVFFLRYTAIESPFGDDVRVCKEKSILAICEDDDE